MAESLLFSVNVIFPIFLLVIAGYFFKRIGLVGDKFFEEGDKFVFKVSLPLLLFLDLVECGDAGIFDGKLVLFCCAGIIITVLLSCLIVPVFIKENPSRGSFVQGIYRSNFAILGITLAENMFGEEGIAEISVVMPFAIALFNAFAVIVFSVFAPEDKKLPPAKLAGKILLNIVKNPLIIAVVLAVPFMIFRIPLPEMLTKGMKYLSNICTPLALMSMGAGFSFATMKNKLGRAVTAAAFKIVILPLVVVIAAILLGFRGAPLGIIYILFGGPSAVSGYIMAKNMYGDYELTGYITILTTFFCIATMFISIFLLRYFSFI